MRGPDDFAVGGGELLRSAKVVELVVERLGIFWTKALQQDQRTETVRFVEVTAMPIRVMLRNQLVALPEKLRRYVVDGFTDAPTKWVIAVAGCLPVGLGDAN